MNEREQARIIAFNLPQYHQIPENDLWWGEGFTEWTNVRKAVPQFPGHMQPRLPADQHYYDLTDPQTHHRQQQLARQYGIGAFCHYVYWFAGKRLLERPLDVIRDNPDLTLPYCLCWANESWTRTWDGGDSLILQPQRHDRVEDARIVDDLAEHLTDPRYLRVDGKPLLLIYRHTILDSPLRTTDAIRERAIQLGIGELHLAMVQSFDAWDPTGWGLDAAVEFPPHGLFSDDCAAPFQHPVRQAARESPRWVGRTLSYPLAADVALSRPAPDFLWYRGVMTSFDNTPRRNERGALFADATPAAFQAWLEEALAYTYLFQPPGKQLLFVNAWNEWGEGAYLEPDTELGTARLEAVAAALARTSALAERTATVAPDDPLLEAARARFRPMTIAATVPQTQPSSADSPTVDAETRPATVPTVPPIFLATSDEPVVSVLIPVHGHWDFTERCLRSIELHPPRTPYEIIVVDDASPDLTPDLLTRIPGIRTLTMAQNAGFLGACNAGFQLCRGEHVMLLNNDTEVTSGWLDTLVDTLDDPAVGAAGSKILFPDGRLQEAGGMIFRDASGWHVGRGSDPDTPEFNFPRVVDYCSGASLLVRRDLLMKLGGFDERFVPAYYEDTDLAFAVRAEGYDVVYQPASVVIHYESVSQVASGTRSYLEINRPKFLEKWGETLDSDHFTPAEFTPEKALWKYTPRVVVVIDQEVPHGERDAAARRTMMLLRLLRSQNYGVVFIPADAHRAPGHTEAVQALGIEVLYGHLDVQHELLKLRDHAVAVFLCRPVAGARHLPAVRQFLPDARVVYYPVTAHEPAGCESAHELLNVERLRTMERAVVEASDTVLAGSAAEQDLLALISSLPTSAEAAVHDR